MRHGGAQFQPERQRLARLARTRPLALPRTGPESAPVNKFEAGPFGLRALPLPPMPARHATRTRLIDTAARLFRARGYHGVGVAEILAASKVQRSTLYALFPGGKAELARAAAQSGSEKILELIGAAFSDAPDYAAGAAAFCLQLSNRFDASQGHDGCPVSPILLQDADNETFRCQADAIFTRWIGEIAAHACRLGIPGEDAEVAAEALLLTIQGAWILARARKSSDPLQQLAVGPQRRTPGQNQLRHPTVRGPSPL